MSQPDFHEHLFDIQQACSLIQEFTMGLTFDEYRDDARTYSAVERQFEILGAALPRMLQAFPELASALPDAPHIVELREVLIQATAPSHGAVWSALESHLPQLAREVEMLLDLDASS
ncbi:MAG TPA: HepT-like ribonuclease domain-containing protein [Thermoanaerobaculia bacterium]|nr:HepT-like ribonuclease domain-containing protein [Thermoanaerobaculia bacterium]